MNVRASVLTIAEGESGVGDVRCADELNSIVEEHGGEGNATAQQDAVAGAGGAVEDFQEGVVEEGQAGDENDFGLAEDGLGVGPGDVAVAGLEFDDGNGVSLGAPDFRLGKVADEASAGVLYEVGEGINGVGLERIPGERNGAVETGVDEAKAESVFGIGEAVGDFGDGAAELVAEIRRLEAGVEGVSWGG